MPPGRSDPGALLRARGSRYGAFAVSLTRVGSTNALARSLAKGGAPHGSVVLAERQDGGKGRWNRRWESGPGGLYVSVVLRPPSPDGLGVLPLTTAVAVSDALAAHHAVSPRLRWPNDVFAGGRKLGGVLVEASFTGTDVDFAIVGIGVNVNQGLEDFPQNTRDRATSLRILTGRESDVGETAAAVLLGLEKQLEGAAAADLERWRELADGAAGAEVRVVSPGGEELVALTDGLAEDGGLRVALPDGSRRTLYSEDVLYLRSTGEPTP